MRGLGRRISTVGTLILRFDPLLVVGAGVRAEVEAGVEIGSVVTLDGIGEAIKVDIDGMKEAEVGTEMKGRGEDVGIEMKMVIGEVVTMTRGITRAPLGRNLVGITNERRDGAVRVEAEVKAKLFRTLW
eukprot:CAMPEP_0197256562 /NCGR_PEP_ID=MMETSP1429-20130617/75759_1 /TAXON_ID=49237 /ORGANISM="Chaetoceros  sp., Strain UNC1202" /LENGTH=128 /DNA_ID=CAMNT_0042720157 /DNA_START=80 /DNA_END=463 /DNA_ORIENTATION=+